MEFQLGRCWNGWREETPRDVFSTPCYILGLDAVDLNCHKIEELANAPGPVLTPFLGAVLGFDWIKLDKCSNSEES